MDYKSKIRECNDELEQLKPQIEEKALLLDAMGPVWASLDLREKKVKIESLPAFTGAEFPFVVLCRREAKVERDLAMYTSMKGSDTMLKLTRWVMALTLVVLVAAGLQAYGALKKNPQLEDIRRELSWMSSDVSNAASTLDDMDRRERMKEILP